VVERYGKKNSRLSDMAFGSLVGNDQYDLEKIGLSKIKLM
jgi:hypothetical protein